MAEWVQESGRMWQKWKILPVPHVETWSSSPHPNSLWQFQYKNKVDICTPVLLLLQSKQHKSKTQKAWYQQNLSWIVTAVWYQVKTCCVLAWDYLLTSLRFTNIRELILSLWLTNGRGRSKHAQILNHHSEVLLFVKWMYVGCSESNAPHFFSHSTIQISMWKLKGSNTHIYGAHVCKYTFIQQIAPL
jgi:hypothetical protein